MERRWSCLLIVACLVATAVAGLPSLCYKENDGSATRVTVVVGNVLEKGEVPVIVLESEQRSRLSPYGCHNAVLAQRMEGTTPKLSSYALLEAPAAEGDAEDSTEVVCDGEECVAGGPIGDTPLVTRQCSSEGNDLSCSRQGARSEHWRHTRALYSNRKGGRRVQSRGACQDQAHAAQPCCRHPQAFRCPETPAGHVQRRYQRLLRRGAL
mmetsp:Transcript_8129/g.34170  ORF Transcript_8129/g.34170 Transcript_8129/m.34170 type:complete len:210 (-) Transcript_8129:566-1195(-)